MKIRNKFILLGAVLFTTSFAYGEKSEALKSYTTENLNYTEMVEKEINDDIFLEFVDGDIVEEPSKNVEIYERYNYNPKNKNKKYNGHYMAFEKDTYGIIANLPNAFAAFLGLNCSRELNIVGISLKLL